MLIPNHPDDERLSALASRDDRCDRRRRADHPRRLLHPMHRARRRARCASCLALADLPDLAPSPAAPPASARRGRSAGRRSPGRLGAPLLRPGPRLRRGARAGRRHRHGGTAPRRHGAAARRRRRTAAVAEGWRAERGGAARIGGAADGCAARAESCGRSRSAAVAGRGRVPAARAAPQPMRSAADERRGEHFDAGPRREAMTASTRRSTAERSPWPMVLFAGVALIIAALLLRWILAPRAG